MLWFMDLSVATFHIQYTFLSLCQLFVVVVVVVVALFCFVFSRENGQNTTNTRSPPFLYDTKMAADGYWARKALTLKEFL